MVITADVLTDTAITDMVEEGLGRPTRRRQRRQQMPLIVGKQSYPQYRISDDHISELQPRRGKQSYPRYRGIKQQACAPDMAITDIVMVIKHTHQAKSTMIDILIWSSPIWSSLIDIRRSCHGYGHATDHAPGEVNAVDPHVGDAGRGAWQGPHQ
jgi:hypothetical protein